MTGHSLSTHHVFVRRRAGESNRQDRCGMTWKKFFSICLGFILIVRKAHLAHRLVDEIPVTGFLPCKSVVDFTILTWDIFRSTDPRQSPLSPVFTFCVTDSSRSQNRLNFVHNHIEPPVKAFTSQNTFFFMKQEILTFLSLSCFLCSTHN